jgi:ABC-type multidrug transport system fused ATPase/permease subunit
MGISSFAGIAVILMLIPITSSVSRYLKKLQSRMAKVRDERIKVSNEVLGGMKVVKFQAWEKEFENRINSIRDQELMLYKRYCIMQSVSGAIFTTVPLIVAIVTFMAYIGLGNTLDVATALTSLALFEILRFPLFMLPNVLNNLVEAKVSIDRVQSFLLEPERELVLSHPLKKPGVLMKKTTLIWDSKTSTQNGEKDKNKSGNKIKTRNKMITRLISSLENRIKNSITSTNKETKNINIHEKNSISLNILENGEKNQYNKNGNHVNEHSEYSTEKSVDDDEEEDEDLGLEISDMDEFPLILGES